MALIIGKLQTQQFSKTNQKLLKGTTTTKRKGIFFCQCNDQINLISVSFVVLFFFFPQLTTRVHSWNDVLHCFLRVISFPSALEAACNMWRSGGQTWAHVLFLRTYRCCVPRGGRRCSCTLSGTYFHDEYMDTSPGTHTGGHLSGTGFAHRLCFMLVMIFFLIRDGYT